MFRDNRVLEFEGAERLAEAHLAALETPDIDAVVVHGITAVIGQDWIEGARGEEPLFQHNLGILYDSVPQLTEVDDVVKQWWAENPCGADLRAYEHDFAYLRTLITGAHVDPTGRGPVTSSVRVDNTGEHRTFYAQATGETSIRGGEVDYEARNRLSQQVNEALYKQGYVSQLFYGKYRGFSKINQRPGDWVIFANHPHPTLHAVSQSGPTQSMVMGFSIDLRD